MESMKKYNAIFTRDGKEYVDYLGKEYPVLKMKDGTKFFEPENPYVTEEELAENIENEVFLWYHNRITDVIRAIRDGYAHCIFGNPNPGNFILFNRTRPIYILDEDKGDQYRKETIEGLKNARFGYSIQFGRKTSFSSHFIDGNGTPCCSLNASDPVFFETRGEAEAVIEHYVALARDAAKKIADNSSSFRDCEKLPHVAVCLLEELIEEGDGTIIMKKDADPFGTYYLDVVQHLYIDGTRNF